MRGVKIIQESATEGNVLSKKILLPYKLSHHCKPTIYVFLVSIFAAVRQNGRGVSGRIGYDLSEKAPKIFQFLAYKGSKNPNKLYYNIIKYINSQP